jgi:uroporphyrinogen decarboxylase
MTPEERVRAAIAGEAVDRAPFGMWGHDYEREWDATGLADATVELANEFEFDFVKINPRFTYFVEDWGGTFDRSAGRPSPKTWPVNSPADFRKLGPLDTTSGALRQQMDALDQVRARLRPGVPFIQTIFSPLSIARNLVGEDAERLLEFIAEDPDSVEAGLDTITEVYAAYARECLEHGAAGIFFATTRMASYDLLTAAQYERWGRPYDLHLLDAVGDAWFNVVHVCQDNNMLELDLVADYPAAAFSWAATSPTNRGLAEGRQMTGRAVLGGISEKTTLVSGTPDEVRAEVVAALETTGGRGILIGPGCSIPPESPRANLAAAREAVAAWRG